MDVFGNFDFVLLLRMDIFNFFIMLLKIDLYGIFYIDGIGVIIFVLYWGRKINIYLWWLCLFIRCGNFIFVILVIFIISYLFLIVVMEIVINF